MSFRIRIAPLCIAVLLGGVVSGSLVTPAGAQAVRPPAHSVHARRRRHAPPVVRVDSTPAPRESVLFDQAKGPAFGAPEDSAITGEVGEIPLTQDGKVARLVRLVDQLQFLGVGRCGRAGHAVVRGQGIGAPHDYTLCGQI
jgi:hypothetical protein